MFSLQDKEKHVNGFYLSCDIAALDSIAIKKNINALQQLLYIREIA